MEKGQKILMGLMLGAMSLMLLGQVLSYGLGGGAQTAEAVLWSGDAPVSAKGVVIRQETVVYAPAAGSWILAVEEGQQVAAGQTVLRWQKTQAAETAGQAVRLLRTGAETEALALISRRQEIQTAVSTLAGTQGQARRAAAETLTGVMLGQGETPCQGALELGEERLGELGVGGGQTVTAPAAGVFSSVCDGLEAVLTPETAFAEWPLPVSPVARRAVGRIITSDTWYFRTKLPRAPAVGETVEVLLESGIFQTVEMEVLSAEEDGDGVQVLLSCQTALSQVAGLRQLSAKFLAKSESGVEIPAAAVYTVEEETGVWCIVGNETRWKPITILRQDGQTVVAVLDRSTTDTLWPGDQVILGQ